MNVYDNGSRYGHIIGIIDSIWMKQQIGIMAQVAVEVRFIYFDIARYLLNGNCGFMTDFWIWYYQ